MRLKVLRIIFLSLLVLIAFNLIYVQVVRGRFYYNQSVNNRIRIIPKEANRGRILDRNGVVLADNRLAFNIAVIPQDLIESEKTFDFLSALLKVDKKKLQQRFYQRRLTPFAPVVIAEDVDKQLAMVVEENKFLFPGLYIQEDYLRRYPLREVGAHVLGYVGKINRVKMEQLKDYGYSPLSVVGYSGIEEYYDQYLKGKEGGSQIEVNNRGQQVHLLSVREPEGGEDIQLTIDARIQIAAQAALADKRGTIIVLDFDSGEILGMVSSPTYDPHVFVDSKSKSSTGRIFTDAQAPLLNRAIKGQFPPGSIFKTIVAMAALSTNKINVNTSFLCPGYLSLGRQRFRCAHVHGRQNLLEGIAHSCNVYFFNVGLLLGPDVISKYARMFGFGNITRVDLPFEEKGFVPSTTQRRKKPNPGWYRGDTVNYSIGQGELLVTPLQVVRLITTIGRSGQEIQPHLLKAIGSREMVKLATVRIIRLKPGIFETLQKGLYEAVHDAGGTARLLNTKDFSIAGKTGTAQSIPGQEDHAWFAGYTTTGQKKIAFCVFLEFGGSSYNAVVVSNDLLKKFREQEIL
jgi:penicillin-binding protein 2